MSSGPVSLTPGVSVTHFRDSAQRVAQIREPMQNRSVRGLCLSAVASRKGAASRHEDPRPRPPSPISSSFATALNAEATWRFSWEVLSPFGGATRFLDGAFAQLRFDERRCEPDAAPDAGLGAHDHGVSQGLVRQREARARALARNQRAFGLMVSHYRSYGCNLPTYR